MAELLIPTNNVTKEINSSHHPYLIKWDHLCEYF